MVFILGTIFLLFVVILLIAKEYVISFSKLSHINSELEKYNSKNTYEVRRLMNTVIQSKKIIENSENLEEKIHWCDVIISSYKTIREKTPEIIHKKVDKKIYKYTKRLETLRKLMIIQKKERRQKYINLAKEKDKEENNKKLTKI